MTSKILGWPGYMVFQQEIDEKAKTLKLWVRRKRGNRRLNGFLEDVHGAYGDTIRIVNGARAYMDRDPVPVPMAKQDVAFPWLAVLHNGG
jgi:hypothetical protein